MCSTGWPSLPHGLKTWFRAATIDCGLSLQSSGEQSAIISNCSVSQSRDTQCPPVTKVTCREGIVLNTELTRGGFPYRTPRPTTGLLSDGLNGVRH